MRDRGWIAAGLLVLLCAATFPFWYDLTAGKASKIPQLSLPAGEKECVAPAEYMKTSHMRLLSDWREQVVRNDIRVYTAENGRTFAMSLTATCLRQCHVNKAGFCDRCHVYNGVPVPYCWDCHVVPQQGGRTAQGSEPAAGGVQDGGR